MDRIVFGRFSRLLTVLSVTALGFVASGTVLATVPITPLIVEADGMTIDWSRHQARFAGRYAMPGSRSQGPSAQGSLDQVSPQRQGDLVGHDRKARFQGYAQLYQSALGQQLLAAMSRDALRGMVRSSNTEYARDGEVVVNLRMNLAEALGRYHKAQAAQPSAQSGVKVGVRPRGKPLTLVLTGPLKPAGTYTLKDRGGRTLHSVAGMIPGAFRKNLMASWFRYPASGRDAVVAGLKKARPKAPVLVADVVAGAVVLHGESNDMSRLRPYLAHGAVEILVPR